MPTTKPIVTASRLEMAAMRRAAPPQTTKFEHVPALVVGPQQIPAGCGSSRRMG